MCVYTPFAAFGRLDQVRSFSSFSVLSSPVVRSISVSRCYLSLS